MSLSNQFSPQTYERPGYVISTNPNWIDLDVIHSYLANESYWASGITREPVVRALEYSLCFGVYSLAENGRTMIGSARIVSDFARIAHLADVFILPDYQGQGLGKWLIECMLSHPELQGVSTWTLKTADAHTFYSQFGFTVDPPPDKHMVYRPQ